MKTTRTLLISFLTATPLGQALAADYVASSDAVSNPGNIIYNVSSYARSWHTSEEPGTNFATCPPGSDFTKSGSTCTHTASGNSFDASWVLIDTTDSSATCSANSGYGYTAKLKQQNNGTSGSGTLTSYLYAGYYSYCGWGCDPWTFVYLGAHSTGSGQTNTASIFKFSATMPDYLLITRSNAGASVADPLWHEARYTCAAF